MSGFNTMARNSHRKEVRDSIVDAPQKPELSGQEFILHRALRSAIHTASIYGVSKTKAAAVMERTLREMAFQANVKA